MLRYSEQLGRRWLDQSVYLLFLLHHHRHAGSRAHRMAKFRHALHYSPRSVKSVTIGLGASIFSLFIGSNGQPFFRSRRWRGHTGCPRRRHLTELSCHTSSRGSYIVERVRTGPVSKDDGGSPAARLHAWESALDNDFADQRRNVKGY